MQKNKTNHLFALAIPFFLLVFSAATAFAQTAAKQIVVQITAVEFKPDTISLFGSSRLLPNADFQKKYLDKGSVKNKFTIIAQDGGSNEWSIGRQIPVIQKGLDSQSFTEIINAGTFLKVSPQIIEDENGNAASVRLALDFADNEIDPAVKTDDAAIAVIKREIKTVINLKYGETAVLGGFKENGAERYYGITLMDESRQIKK